MPFANSNHRFGTRNGTGLVITVGVHALAIVAVLTNSNVIELSTKRTPEAITTIPVIDEPIRRETPPEPRPVEQPIDFTVVPPIIDHVPDQPPILANPLPLPLPPIDADPSTLPSGDAPVQIVQQPKLPVEIAAKIDPRHADALQPIYPEISKRLEEEGVVILRVLIGPDGRVKQVEVKTSSGYDRLDQAALRQARRAWRFLPATRDGMAIESWKELPIRFELKNG